MWIGNYLVIRLIGGHHNSIHYSYYPPIDSFVLSWVFLLYYVAFLLQISCITLLTESAIILSSVLGHSIHHQPSMQTVITVTSTFKSDSASIVAKQR